MSYTVNDIGKRVHICCGNHQDGDAPLEMMVGEGRFGGFWSCPKYSPEGRESFEVPCYNRLNFLDYEKLLEKLSQEYVAAEENGQQIMSLKGLSWKVKNVEYKVIEDNKDGIFVSVINRAALQGVKHYY